MVEPFVLDCSVVMSWCFEDEAVPYAEKVLDAFSDTEAIAPSLLPLEVGNVLLVAERHKRISRAAILRFASLLTSLPISIEPEPPGRAMSEILSLARTYRLSTYDASYLDLALRRGVSLATRDQALRRAAKHCDVKLFGVK